MWSSARKGQLCVCRRVGRSERPLNSCLSDWELENVLEESGSGNCFSVIVVWKQNRSAEHFPLPFLPLLFFRHRKVLNVMDIVIRLRRQWDAALHAKYSPCFNPRGVESPSCLNILNCTFPRTWIEQARVTSSSQPGLWLSRVVLGHCCLKVFHGSWWWKKMHHSIFE